MEKVNQVVLSLGSNLGNREANLTQACHHIHEVIGPISRTSPIYETPPLGFEADTSFLNMCLACSTFLSPTETLAKIHLIEAAMGRTRSGNAYISRTIDIDIIFYEQLIQSSESPLLPHPSFHERKFVLIPLNDLDPKLKDPRSQSTVDQLLAQCKDDSQMQLFKNFIFPSH